MQLLIKKGEVKKVVSMIRLVHRAFGYPNNSKRVIDNNVIPRSDRGSARDRVGVSDDDEDAVIDQFSRFLQVTLQRRHVM